MPKNLRVVLGAILVVTVIQYALLTGLVNPVPPVAVVFQIFCYLLLAAALFRAVIQRSRLAWLITQIMLSALFAFSVLFTATSAVLSLKTESLWLLLALSLITALSNGLLLGFLFSLPVCEYFRPADDTQDG
jgi:ABC-type Na+ efflux pump permease subunit